MGPSGRPGSRTLGIRISEKEREKLDLLCRETDQSYCEMIRTLIALAVPPRFEPVRLTRKEPVRLTSTEPRHA